MNRIITSLSLTTAFLTGCSTLPPPEQFRDYALLSAAEVESFNACVNKTDSRLAKAYAATHPIVRETRTAEDFEKMTPQEGRAFLLGIQKDTHNIVDRMERRLEASMAICANQQGINPATTPKLQQ